MVPVITWQRILKKIIIINKLGHRMTRKLVDLNSEKDAFGDNYYTPTNFSDKLFARGDGGHYSVRSMSK